jgi:RNA methyltransferase, TrmH family
MTDHTITSLQHPLVKHLVKLRTDVSYRNEHQSLILTGLKPIQEFPSGIAKLLYTADYRHVAEEINGVAERWLVAETIIHKIAGMLSPEGILAEVQMPPFVPLMHNKVVALDGISDPGNLGTLLRTALAFGWEAVYFLPGSCDPYNEKALRAARGAHFKLALAKGTAENLQQWVETHSCQALVAELKGLAPETVPAAYCRLLVLGNEAHGSSASIKQFCSSVSLPMPGAMESLNVAVAGGILLYLLRSNERE